MCVGLLIEGRLNVGGFWVGMFIAGGLKVGGL